MKNRIMKLPILFICVVLLCLMTACNKEKEASVIDNIATYHAENLMLEGISGLIADYVIQQDKVYIYSVEEEDYHFYIADISGNVITEIPLSDGPEIAFVDYMTVDKNGVFSVIANMEATGETHLISFDMEGKLLLDADISEEWEWNALGGVCDFLVDKEGNFVMVFPKNVLILDHAGNKIAELPSSNEIMATALTKDGNIVCGINDEKVAIKIIDTKKYDWEKNYELELNYLSGSGSLINGCTYDFYYRDDKYLYGFDAKENCSVKLMDFVNSYIDASYTDLIVAIDENSFIARDIMAGSLVKYQKGEATKDERTVITFGVVYAEDDVQKAVMDFNRNNKEYKVELISYDSYEDPYTQLALDVASGKVPDVLEVSTLPIRQYVQIGLLEDLSGYLEKDADVGEEDLLDSVVEAMKIDDKLYYIAPAFGISTMYAKKSEVGDVSGWTVEEMLQYIQSKPEDTWMFQLNTKEEVLGKLVYACVDDYINWETGECQFESQQFKDILTIANRAATEDEYEPATSSLPERLQTGKVCFMESVNDDLMNVLVNMSLFNEEAIAIGYPNAAGNGSYFAFNKSYGISATSDNKDGAWEFVKTFISKQYQYDIVNTMQGLLGTPTRKDNFDMFLKFLQATENYTDEMGNVIEPYQNSGMDYEIPRGPMSEAETELVWDIINSIHRVDERNDTISNIILEEARYYFNGDKNLDEIAKIINTRISTYVNENK